MNEHDDQKKRNPFFATSKVVAFGVGLLLCFIGSRLDPIINLYSVLFLPLLLGMIGMLMVSARKKRPLFNGLGPGWLVWVGVWLSFVVWESFQPQTLDLCNFHEDQPCGPTTVPFWGKYAGLFLSGYFVYLALGLVFVAVGSASTSLMLDFVRWIRNKLKPSL
jgi:hypothetical protein